jgi:hypothetical protein
MQVTLTRAESRLDKLAIGKIQNLRYAIQLELNIVVSKHECHLQARF